MNVNIVHSGLFESMASICMQEKTDMIFMHSPLCVQ